LKRFVKARWQSWSENRTTPLTRTNGNQSPCQVEIVRVDTPKKRAIPERLVHRGSVLIVTTDLGSDARGLSFAGMLSCRCLLPEVVLQALEIDQPDSAHCARLAQYMGFNRRLELVEWLRPAQNVERSPRQAGIRLGVAAARHPDEHWHSARRYA
jgi:hypothetical protein